MVTSTTEMLALTTGDVMARDVVVIPRRTPLPDAAALLRRADVGGAPVVDEQGRCVGILTASDFLRRASREAPRPPACPYQIKGRLLTGEAAVVCTLAEGSCPLQQTRPLLGGRHGEVCLHPAGALTDWQQLSAAAAGTAEEVMTGDLVTVAADTPLAEVARVMVDAHIHHVPVLDENGKPIGIVSSTDVLAAVARERNTYRGEMP